MAEKRGPFIESPESCQRRGAFRRVCGRIPSLRSVRHRAPRDSRGDMFGSEHGDGMHQRRRFGRKGVARQYHGHKKTARQPIGRLAVESDLWLQSMKDTVFKLLEHWHP
jgi:hypothetical protein